MIYSLIVSCKVLILIPGIYKHMDIYTYRWPVYSFVVKPSNPGKKKSTILKMFAMSPLQACGLVFNYYYVHQLCLFLSHSLTASGPGGNYKEFQTVVLETWDSPPTIILQINCCGLNWTHTLRSTEQLKVHTGENPTHSHTSACARTHTHTN